MKTEMQVCEKKPAKAPAAEPVLAEVAPRLRGTMKVIFGAMQGFHSSSRQELLAAAKKAGYSAAEFDDVLNYLVKTPVLVGQAPVTAKVAAPDVAATQSAVSQQIRSLEQLFKSLLIERSNKKFALTREGQMVYARNKQIIQTYQSLHSKLQELKDLISGTKPQAFDPHEAGRRLVEELQAAEGGAWTGQELQARFNLTSAVLHRRRKEHRIVYWRDARHEFHYPVWQFTPTGALLPGIQEVLALFKSLDEWRVMRYFLGRRAQLSGQRPIDLLRQDAVEKVLEHAKIHAQENTW